jgi:hypothetical protein
MINPQSRRTICPPPMRVVRKGWWIYRELTHAQAERYHLRQAAQLVGKPEQQDHLDQAYANRMWGAGQ